MRFLQEEKTIRYKFSIFQFCLHGPLYCSVNVHLPVNQKTKSIVLLKNRTVYCLIPDPNNDVGIASESPFCFFGTFPKSWNISFSVFQALLATIRIHSGRKSQYIIHGYKYLDLHPSSLHHCSLLPVVPCCISHPAHPSQSIFEVLNNEKATIPSPRHLPLSRQGHPWCCCWACAAAAEQHLFLVRESHGGLPAASLPTTALGPSGHWRLQQLAVKHADDVKLFNMQHSSPLEVFQ